MRKSIRKLIEGKQVIGAGVSRIVYDLGNGYVLKVVRSERAIKYNQREVRMYKSCPSPVRKYLANIIKNGKNWLIMKKYDREFPETEEYARKLRILISEFEKQGITPSDIKRENLRLGHNGKIMVIDYANFKFRGK